MKNGWVLSGKKQYSYITTPTVEEVTLMEGVTLTGGFSMVTFPDKVPVITAFQ